MKAIYGVITEVLKEMGKPISFNEVEKVERLRTEQIYIEQELEGNQEETMEVTEVGLLPQATSTPNLLQGVRERRKHTKGKTIFIPFESEEDDSSEEGEKVEKLLQRKVETSQSKKIPQEKGKVKIPQVEKPSTSEEIPQESISQTEKLRVLREEMFSLNYEPTEELTQVDPETFDMDDVILRKKVDENPQEEKETDKQQVSISKSQQDSTSTSRILRRNDDEGKQKRRGSKELKGNPDQVSIESSAKPSNVDPERTHSSYWGEVQQKHHKNP
jgi:hypothetical protein